MTVNDQMFGASRPFRWASCIFDGGRQRINLFFDDLWNAVRLFAKGEPAALVDNCAGSPSASHKSCLVFLDRREVWFTGFARVNLCKGFRTNSFTRLTVIKGEYRGQVCVLLINLDEEDFTIRRGDRIAQGIIAAAPQWALVEVDDLDATDRGAEGFGSTGV